jgi:17beta-estradiol 17-dehydrogenase / very-long-chain 3-oxoacyl-CoA reductase
MDLILISRTPAKLDATKQEIAEKYPSTEIKTIAIDFSKFDKSAAAKLEQDLSGLEIGVLVNNVGVGYPFPEYLTKLDMDTVWDLMQVNMIPVTVLTRIVLPGMEARRRGAIINISSTSAFFPTGMLTIYSAAKAYVDYFSRALQQEVGKGIIVQSVLPGFVTTKLSKIRKSSVTTPTPRLYVKQALASLGSGSEMRTAGYWSHWLTEKVMNVIPQPLVDKFVLNMHKDINRRALKKQASVTNGSKKE